MQIYEGTDDTGSKVVSVSGSRAVDPKAFVSSSGQIFLRLVSTSINSGRGFKAIFSKG